MTGLIVGSKALTMSSLDMVDLVGKRHDSVKRTIENMVDKGVIAQPQVVILEDINGLGLTRKTSVYVFDLEHKRDTYVVVAQLSPEYTGKVVDRWQELEAQVKNVPALPATYVEALRALADEAEAKELALVERDQAIKTKAEIGSKREATAMATASVAARKVKKLEIELDKSKEFATVKRVEIMLPGNKFPWKPLKDYSKIHNIPMGKVPDQNYGEVNSYRSDVWLNVYGVRICQST